MSAEQIRLYLRRLDQLSSPSSPTGYIVRPMMSGEEQAWWQLLDEIGDLGMWGPERAKEEFADPSGRVWKDSIHFAVFNDRVIGTACVQLNAERDDLPELGWVAVAREHRGRGLGRVLCLCVIQFMRRHGFQHCFVRTRPTRTAAVKLFQDLGFELWGDPGALPHRPRTR